MNSEVRADVIGGVTPREDVLAKAICLAAKKEIHKYHMGLNKEGIVAEQHIIERDYDKDNSGD